MANQARLAWSNITLHFFFMCKNPSSATCFPKYLHRQHSGILCSIPLFLVSSAVQVFKYTTSIIAVLNDPWILRNEKNCDWFWNLEPFNYQLEIWRGWFSCLTAEAQKLGTEINISIMWKKPHKSTLDGFGPSQGIGIQFLSHLKLDWK